MTKILSLCLKSNFTEGFSYQDNILPKYYVKMGLETVVVASLRHFSDSGDIVMYDHEFNKIAEDGYKLYRIDAKGKGFWNKVNDKLGRFNNLYSILVAERPDIIYSHGITYMDSRFVIRYKKENPEVRIIADSHADLSNTARNFFSKYVLSKGLWRVIANQFEPYIEKCYGVTPIRCEFLKEMYHMKSSKIDLLVMGIDDEKIPQNIPQLRNNIRKKLNINEDDFVIISGGKLDEFKNTDVLINAFSKIEKKNVHLIVFGSITSSCERKLKPLMTTKNIHYVGWCDSEQVMQFLSISDLACYPGRHSTLWEQSVGLSLPCVFKDWGDGMHHVDINGNCSFIVGEDEEALTNELNSLIFTEKYYLMKEASKVASIHFKYSDIARKSIAK